MTRGWIDKNFPLEKGKKGMPKYGQGCPCVSLLLDGADLVGMTEDEVVNSKCFCGQNVEAVDEDLGFGMRKRGKSFQPHTFCLTLLNKLYYLIWYAERVKPADWIIAIDHVMIPLSLTEEEAIRLTEFEETWKGLAALHCWKKFAKRESETDQPTDKQTIAFARKWWKKLAERAFGLDLAVNSYSEGIAQEGKGCPLRPKPEFIKTTA